ncbi:unnamed protein product [Brassicogethes aeneus]|uniref:Peptidase S1 domain-containing protein n=1 Tax=Brassicogethes aeneus TaxID=1431903 RepID=A0A9P0FR27_BRAAE|nr:unnamed protein product [Brassicogethes aeneus]
MSTLTCVTISTLVIISLFNMVLLMGIMMQLKQKCEEGVVNIPNNVEFNRLSSLVNSRRSKSQKPKFMAALVAIKYNKLILMCGTTIISKFWILSTAHCCNTIKDYPSEDVKVSSNSPKWKLGVPHDILDVIIHKNYSPDSATHNLCLIRVRQMFKDAYEIPVAIASSRYKYIANSTALALGWSSEVNDIDLDKDDIYSTNVRLINYEKCRKMFKNHKIDNSMVCGKNYDKNDCNFDSGGPLFQNNVVIGVVSFETDCANGFFPKVYTRISFFEDWLKQVEALKGVKINAVFKS